jgi:hypothetical protein
MQLRIENTNQNSGYRVELTQYKRDITPRGPVEIQRHLEAICACFLLATHNGLLCDQNDELYGQHGVTSKKTVLFTAIALTASNLVYTGHTELRPRRQYYS